MFSLLLKKALPFTLSLGLGVALAGLTGLFEGAVKKDEAPLVTRTYDFGGRCRMRSRRLVAETKPLVILFKPNARWPREAGARGEGAGCARVLVTFGADGKVQAVEPLEDWLIAAWREWPATGKDPAEAGAWKAVERAARQIQFLPETINGMPVSVTKEIEIRLAGD